MSPRPLLLDSTEYSTEFKIADVNSDKVTLLAMFISLGMLWVKMDIPEIIRI